LCYSEPFEYFDAAVYFGQRELLRRALLYGRLESVNERVSFFFLTDVRISVFQTVDGCSG